MSSIVMSGTSARSSFASRRSPLTPRRPKASMMSARFASIVFFSPAATWRTRAKIWSMRERGITRKMAFRSAIEQAAFWVTMIMSSP